MTSTHVSEGCEWKLWAKAAEAGVDESPLLLLLLLLEKGEGCALLRGTEAKGGRRETGHWGLALVRLSPDKLRLCL